MKPVLQVGNGVSASWRARLDEHLGNYTIEPVNLRASSFFAASHAIYGVSHLAALMRLLPERDPHADLYAEFEDVLNHLDDAVVAAPMVVRFELQLLSELGFGLDLEQCASTGTRADLIYVSPKSGRAVSREAGEPWADKMLRLPAFLHERDASRPAAISTTALRLPGFSWRATCWSRAGLRFPRSARISSRRSCAARAAHWRSDGGLRVYCNDESGRSSGKGP